MVKAEHGEEKVNSSVTVRFFASIAEATGVTKMTAMACDTADLMTVLAEHLSDDAVQAINQDNVRIAVNQSMIDGVTPLANGDEVAFLPPITGG